MKILSQKNLIFILISVFMPRILANPAKLFITTNNYSLKFLIGNGKKRYNSHSICFIYQWYLLKNTVLFISTVKTVFHAAAPFQPQLEIAHGYLLRRQNSETVAGQNLFFPARYQQEPPRHAPRASVPGRYF